MKIIASNIEIQNKLTESYNRIIDNCRQELKTKIEDTPIICTDERKVKEIYDDGIRLFEKSYINGLGGHKGSIKYDEQHFDLIVLNVNSCNNLNLSDDEFDGVFSHELGHIFNKYSYIKIPSAWDVFKGATKLPQEKEAQIRYENVLNNEACADEFSFELNTHLGLISSIEKFNSANPTINNKLFQDRLARMRNRINGNTIDI